MNSSPLSHKRKIIKSEKTLILRLLRVKTEMLPNRATNVKLVVFPHLNVNVLTPKDGKFQIIDSDSQVNGSPEPSPAMAPSPKQESSKPSFLSQFLQNRKEQVLKPGGYKTD